MALSCDLQLLAGRRAPQREGENAVQVVGAAHGLLGLGQDDRGRREGAGGHLLLQLGQALPGLGRRASQHLLFLEAAAGTAAQQPAFRDSVRGTGSRQFVNFDGRLRVAASAADDGPGTACE